jgi:polysaccharide export outer membrane protein
LKQIITLLLIILLFSSSVFAAQNVQTVETVLPGSTEIQESTPPAVTVNPSDTKVESEVKVEVPSGVPPSPPVNNPVVTNFVADDPSAQANYYISPGDNLEISVWKEEGLQQQQYLVAPDGDIIFPLIGTVHAVGKTITELKQVLTTKLADYISEPSVTVKLMNNYGNAIFVIGKVTKPGQYVAGRRIDVLQALSLAGGLTVYASSGSISILRRVGNETKVFPFDYDNVIKGEELEQNILLEPGDTITVP